jgi:hypothetical protein
MSTYAEIQAAISQAQPVAYHAGNISHGEKSGYGVTAVCDFSASGIPDTGYAIDTTVYTNRAQMKTVQTVFIDNSQNNGYVDVKNPVFGQSFSLPPGFQGYFPILAPALSGAKFSVTSTGNQLANIIFLNTLMPLASWAATVTPPSAGNPQTVADPILDATVSANRVNATSIEAQATATDVSGTITAGGTAQLLIPQNNARRKFSIINIDSTLTGEALWWGFTSGITPGAPGAYPLAAAASIAYPGGAYEGNASNAIYIVAATTGHKFSAFWE